ncbi:MAG: hypothetical protein Q7T80_16240 [Methanoregula sp.]|nr:hypothetical protein [Methanoregula sp.]
MKFSLIGIFTILLVIITVVFTGCTNSTPSAPLVTTPQVTATMTKTTATPAITTARPPSTPVLVKTTENPVKIFNGEYHWVEYRLINSVTMPPNPRSQWVYNIKTERSYGPFKGIPAVRYKITSISDYPELAEDIVTITKDGWIIVDDRYYDTDTGMFLGGTETNTIKGILKPTTDIPAYQQYNREDAPSSYTGINPFGEMNITFSDQGTESVTVPAGTYPEARKYLGMFKDGTPITFWVARGVPVPVKYEFPNKYQDGVNPFDSFELKGWG